VWQKLQSNIEQVKAELKQKQPAILMNASKEVKDKEKLEQENKSVI
jgi:hypothetical protein